MGGLLALLGKIGGAAKAGYGAMKKADAFMGKMPTGGLMGGAGQSAPYQAMPQLPPPQPVGVTPEYTPTGMTPDMMMRWRMMQQQRSRPNFGMTMGDY